jgi:hypothetical protein
MKIRYIVGRNVPKSIPELLYDMVKNAIGHENAVSREWIIKSFADNFHVDIDERGIRLAAEKIRNEGKRLIDLEDGAGLFIARTEEEYQHFRARYGSHAFTLLKTIRAMDKGVNVSEISDFEAEQVREQYIQTNLLG